MRPSDWTADDLREARDATLASDGWQMVILPALQARLKAAQAQLETATTRPLEDLRALQREIGLLREFVERPREAFKP